VEANGHSNNNTFGSNDATKITIEAIKGSKRLYARRDVEGDVLHFPHP
jgi:hypothetical protein